MANRYIKLIAYAGIGALFLFTSACEEEDPITNDVQEALITSEISELSDNAVDVGAEYTISGSRLDLVASASLGGKNVEILSKDESSLTFRVPRIFQTGPVSVTNKYKRTSSTEQTLAPVYPEIRISGWPAAITAGEAINVQGTNVDLINKINITVTDVNTEFHPSSLIGTQFEVQFNGEGADPSSVNIPTRNINLPFGSTIRISAEGYNNITENANSPADIAVIAPSDFFDPVEPIVLWDFEDGVNPLQEPQNSVVYSLNGSDIPKGIGQHYLTIKKDATPGWTDFGYIDIGEPIDITDFHEPHLSFYINTGQSGGGYFQLEDGQGNWYHFRAQPDDYKFVTEGWEWRSYDLNEVLDGQPLDFSNFQVRLFFKSGNVGNSAPENFELNLDHVMITDGPVQVAKVLFDFESGDNAFITNGGTATISTGNGVASIQGDNFISVTKSPIAGAWDWTGELLVGETDLSELARPYINFWLNTGNNYGNIQILIMQDGSETGANPFDKVENDFGGYTINTEGEWRFYSFSMADLWPNNDVGAPIEQIKVGFTAGNQASGAFEVNMDYMTITDGPMFFYPEKEE